MILDLPDEDIIEILRYIPLKDLLLGVALACKRLHMLTKTARLWTCLMGKTKRSSNFVKNWLSQSNRVRHIYLEFCEGIDDSVMHQLAEQTNLRTLNLQG